MVAVILALGATAIALQAVANMEIRNANQATFEQLAEARRKRAAHHASRPPPSVTGELRVLTYNVWFEHEDTFAKRMAAIARECAGADIVGFQEVTDDSFPYLEAALKRQGFQSLLKQTTPAPYYCCVAAKKPLRQVRTHPFPRSMMGRGVWNSESPLPRFTAVLSSLIPSVSSLV